MQRDSKISLFLGISFLAFAASIGWLTHTIQPLIEPATKTIAVVQTTCETFNAQAAPAVKGINELTSTVKGLTIRDLFRDSSAEDLTEEILFGDRPQYSRQQVEMWVHDYVEKQEMLMRGGKNRPTRAEVRQELIAQFPGMTILMVLYYVVMILSML